LTLPRALCALSIPDIPVTLMRKILPAVQHHHERWDSAGSQWDERCVRAFIRAQQAESDGQNL